jgi:hypothetical protein
LGIASLALMYMLMGMLTCMAALGLGGAKVDQSGLFPFLFKQPWGRLGLGLLALGMAAYVLWRLVQAWADPAHYGLGPKGICLRGCFLISAGIYASLTAYALQMVWDGHPHHVPENIPLMVGTLLQRPYGRIWVGLVALAISIVAIVQFYRAATERFRRQIPDPGINRRHTLLIRWTGRLGFTARGVMLMTVAWLFIRSALHANPREAGGVKRAWDFLEAGPSGHVALAAVACGLAVYGFFLAIKAWGLQRDLQG